MSQPPTGTVTFLFTDIEGSTKLWEQHPEAMRPALARHDVLLCQSIESCGGYVFKTVGDAFCAAFSTAHQALEAALAAQLALAAEPWDLPAPLKVRMALHTGVAEERGGDYFGQTLNRIARLMATGQGGQTLLSGAAQASVQDALPAAVTLLDLGRHRLKDLGHPEQVYQLQHPALPAEFAPIRSLDNVRSPNNLPQQATSFIGRETQVAAVKDALGRTRLLTLTGAGGNGKTRLALQVAADLLDGETDGVWFVELAALAAPDLVPRAAAEVLGVKEQAGQPMERTLVDALKDKRLLLVVDNCEHLVAACAFLASALLRSCPGVRILASSREPLNVSGEQTFRVPALALPDTKAQTAQAVSEFEAVRLFSERAQAVQPSFAVTDRNASAVAQVCRRLDGIPLALELAAARVRSLSVDEINSRLDSRFRLLTGGARNTLPRQQTLRALIDWSYDLLSEPEKTLLCRLSVFAGGWTLGAAEAVCEGDGVEEWEVLDLITALEDKSLVVSEQRGERMRSRLLETVRQYACDRLGERGGDAPARVCHRDYFLRSAEEADLGTRGPEQGQWLDWFESEHDNLRAALDGCREESEGEEDTGAELGLRLVKAMYRFWRVRGHLAEGRGRLAAAVGHSGARQHPLERASALRVASGLEQVEGNLTAARALAEEALALFESTENARGGAGVLLTLGNVALMQEDLAGARDYYERGLPLYRKLDEQDGIARALGNLAMIMLVQGDLAEAKVICEECLAIFRKSGDTENSARALGNLGDIAYAQGDDAEARRRLEEALTLFRQIGARSGALVGSLRRLGAVALRQGRRAEARTRMAEGLHLAGEIKDGWAGAEALEAWAKLCLAEGHAAQAACLLGATAQTRRTSDTSEPAASQAAREADVLAAKAALGETDFGEAWTLGEQMTWEQAVEYALAEKETAVFEDL